MAQWLLSVISRSTKFQQTANHNTLNVVIFYFRCVKHDAHQVITNNQ